MSGLILHTSEDGKSRIQLHADGPAFWLSQLGMAELFQTSKQNIAKHMKTIFADGELRANERYLAFDEQCKQQEARAADAADATELAAIEDKIKQRLKP